MSLLDDVSIVVTPNGYKAGELYAVVPVPAEGSEQVTNGDFSNGETGWSFGDDWSVVGGQATTTGALLTSINQNALVEGTNRLTFDIISGGALIYTNYPSFSLKADFSTTGTHTIDLESDGIGSNRTLYIYNRYAGNSSTIDNVSVKEVVTVSADMDVTRATAATRVDENGLVNYAEIIGSEEITNGDFADWTADVPDSWSVVDSGDASSNVTQNPTGQCQIISDGTLTYIQQNSLVIGVDYRLQYDITNYVSGLLLLDLTVDIPLETSIGSYSVDFTATSGGFVIKRQGACNVTIDKISVKEVTRDNVPRIDYSGGGCPHILAEPQRTNLITYSEDFSQSAWVKSGVTLTSNYSTSPDGTLNATRVTGSASSSMLQSFVYFSNESQTVTVSFYAKGTGKFRIKNTQGNVVDNYSSNYDVTSDWERYSYTITNTSSSSGVQIVGITGNSTGAAYDLSIWGMQLEIGSYPTSIIPTSGSTVTRNQDQFSRDGISSLINSEEGVLFWEGVGFINGGSEIMLSLSDGTSTNVIQSILHSTASRIIFRIILGGVNTVNLSSFDISQTENLKIALKWKENDFALWINGVEKASLTSGSTFSTNTINQLNFADSNGASNAFYGKVKQLQVYKTALSDEQLIQLTGTSGTDFYESYAEMASALTYTIQ